jgi:hypothetical protein
MKYDYPNLGDDQFEGLIVALCQELFGLATQGFSKGPDGGRDARFHGTADQFPSKQAPWVGKTIIQAKHTNGYGKSFSDREFFYEDNKSCIIRLEIPRIIKLREQKELDHYALFSNRRLTGGAESKIRKYISSQTGIPESSIALVDVEQLERWLKRFPKVVEVANIDPVDSPLHVSPDELAEVIEALLEQKDDIKDSFTNPTQRTSYKEKNEINRMSEGYAKEQVRMFLKDTNKIESFLADPINEELLQKYDAAAMEFNFKIISKQKNYQSFDEIMEYLLELLIARDPILKRNIKLTRSILFYMYWNCDIGKKTEDEHAETI